MQGEIRLSDRSKRKVPALRMPISLPRDGLDLAVGLRIVLYCARATLNPELFAAVTDLAEQITDWDDVLGLAARHGLLPLLVKNISRTVPGRLPQIVITDVRRRCTSQNRSLSMELCGLTSLFAAQPVRVIAYKGPTLASMAYKTQPLRSPGDLDFLVHPGDYRGVFNLLRAQGYIPYLDCGYKCHFWHPTKQIDLDLHRALVPRWYRFKFSFDCAWQRSFALAMANGGSVPTFCLEDLVIVLCLDLVKDIAQPWNFRLIKVTDIAELLESNDAIDWTALIYQATAARLVRVIYFSLLLADRLH
jgi:hypothetical protein